VAARRREIFRPYRDHIRALLDERRDGRRAILVAQHSMTDVFKGVRRAMSAASEQRFAERYVTVMTQWIEKKNPAETQHKMADSSA
jgi:predicted N-formylglutamate amidohydrolase